MTDIFTKILEMSLFGSIVIVITILARMFLKKKSKSLIMILWVAVAFRLLCPISIESPLSFFNLLPQKTSVTEIKTETEAPRTERTAVNEDRNVADLLKPAATRHRKPTNEVNTEANVNNDIKDGNKPNVSSVIAENEETSGLDTAVEEATVEEPQVEKTPVKTSGNVWIILGIVWAIGFASLMTYVVVSYICLKRKLKDAEEVERNVYESDKIPSPFVFGIVKPKIYIPIGLGETEKKFILTHERIHIRKADNLRKIIGMICVCIHWFNPVVWLAFTLFERDTEMRCDEEVLKDLGAKVKEDYSLSLVSFATSNRNMRYAVLPVSFSKAGFNKKEVTVRVKNLISYKKGSKILAAVIALALVTVSTSCMLNAKATDKKSDDDTNETEVTETTETTESTETSVNVSEKPTENTTVEAYSYEISYGDVGDININAECDYITNDVLVTDITYNTVPETTESVTFNIPHFNFDTEDARSVNEELSGIVDSYVSGDDAWFYYGSDYCYYIGDNSITVVFNIICDWDVNEYYTYTFDLTTGNRMSNDKIFAASNSEFSSISEAANAATTNYLNSLWMFQDGDEPFIIDGEINPNNHNSYLSIDSTPEEIIDEYLSITFNEDNLNDDMRIGLDSNGNLIFISEIFSLGGASYYTEVYNSEGANISGYLADVRYSEVNGADVTASVEPLDVLAAVEEDIEVIKAYHEANPDEELYIDWNIWPDGSQVSFLIYRPDSENVEKSDIFKPFEFNYYSFLDESEKEVELVYGDFESGNYVVTANCCDFNSTYLGDDIGYSLTYYPTYSYDRFAELSAEEIAGSNIENPRASSLEDGVYFGMINSFDESYSSISISAGKVYSRIELDDYPIAYDFVDVTLPLANPCEFRDNIIICNGSGGRNTPTTLFDSILYNTLMGNASNSGYEGVNYNGFFLVENGQVVAIDLNTWL